MITEKSKILQPITVSSITAIIFITLSTILAEFSPPLKNFLKDTFSHHWLGKSILALALFLIITLAYRPSKLSTNQIIFWLQTLLVVTILGTLLILGLFMYETWLIA